MKIYDCFQFFNELDILEIRLNTLDPYVDYFVLTESKVTHSGKEKPLFYEENKDRFEKFNHKIIHVVVEDTPDGSSFDRDIYQRNVSLSKLKEVASDEDVILSGDLDEIPNPEVLENLEEFFNPDSLYHFEQKYYTYYLNNFLNMPWYGTRMCSLSFLANKTINNIRESTQNKSELNGFIIGEGGWHFTYIGDEERIKQKIESFSHQEFNNEQVKSQILKNLESNKDLFSRPYTYQVVEIDESFPKYIRENLETYKYLIK